VSPRFQRVAIVGVGSEPQYSDEDFAAGSFDPIVCIDAICHLPDRDAVLADWSRLLKPGGRAVFTDPLVVTGPISSREVAVRSFSCPSVLAAGIISIANQPHAAAVARPLGRHVEGQGCDWARAQLAASTLPQC
jgi:SAM-dependent methyltransferase